MTKLNEALLKAKHIREKIQESPFADPRLQDELINDMQDLENTIGEINGNGDNQK